MLETLTIGTVAFDSARHLSLNLRLTKFLNPKSEYSWIILDNSPEGSSLCIKKENPDYFYLPRVETDFKGKGFESYQHGSGLNEIMQYVKSRYVLILDPDFYITRPNWINEVLNFLDEEKISIFGAPWHPNWFYKYRYFPCAHCLFLDLKNVEKESIDFCPEPDNSNKWNSKMRFFFKVLRQEKRCFIGTSFDTGVKLYRKYATKKVHLNICLVPSFRPYYGMSLIKKNMMKALDAVLPDELSLIPKVAGYFWTKTFADLGYFDAYSNGWEEFYWEGKPFGFHLRRFQTSKRKTVDEEIDLLKKSLRSFGLNSDG